MTSRILIDRTKTESGEILRFLNTLEQALAQGRRIKARLNSMSFGSDWHQITLELGLASDVAAQDLWTILSNAMTQFDSAQIAELARLDQA